jgi:hypothetical protein
MHSYLVSTVILLRVQIPVRRMPDNTFSNRCHHRVNFAQKVIIQIGGSEFQFSLTNNWNLGPCLVYYPATYVQVLRVKGQPGATTARVF